MLIFFEIKNLINLCDIVYFMVRGRRFSPGRRHGAVKSAEEKGDLMNYYFARVC